MIFKRIILFWTFKEVFNGKEIKTFIEVRIVN